MGATQDKSRCLPCANADNFDPVIQDCICPLNERVVEIDEATGDFLAAKECSACLSTAYQGPNDRAIYSCAVCPEEGQIYGTTVEPWECTCFEAEYTTAGERCLPNEDVNVISSAYPQASAISINYYYVETEGSDTLSQVSISISDTFSYLYNDAAVGCDVYEDPQKCQMLANLCVLQLYYERAIVCQLFQAIVDKKTLMANAYYNDQGWKLGLPWLYYSRTADQVLYQSNRVKQRVSFGYENKDIGIVKELTYILARFNLTGEFLGWTPMTTELLACESTTEEVRSLHTFGTTLIKECEFDLQRLTSDNQYERPENENIFYELYLQDYNGDLVDIPVLIRNFQDANGGNPNEDGENEENWQLVRRFFMYDTVSGIEENGQYLAGGVGSVVRYAKGLKLQIKLDPDFPEMIYPPLLVIEYRERAKTVIESYSLAEVGFAAEYAMDTSKFWKVTMIMFIVCNVFFLILIVGQMIIWCLTPQLNEDPAAICKFTMVKLLFSAFDLYSYIFFWFMVIFTGYWFIFFKMEERVHVLLPELDTYSENYRPFDVLFGCVLGAKALTILFKITFEQCGFDLFLIDWERPKIRYEYPPNSGQEKMGVNAWRSLFLLNELNELQLEKLISIEFTLFLYLLFMEGAGWKYYCTFDPTFHNTHINSPSNYVLQFFFTSLIMYAIGIVQYVLKYLVKFKLPLKCEELVDLCSICNISILMFDHSFHGYYIHGKSPYGQAEISQEDMKMALEFESEGKAQSRGLTATEPNLQTFEIYMHKAQLRDYKDHFQRDLNQERLNQHEENTKRFNPVEKMLTRSESVPKGQNLESLQDQKNYTNMIFQTYIEQVRTEPRKYIQNRSACQRFLNLPSQIAERGTPIMYRDKWMGFTSKMLMGLDFDFLQLDILVITLIDCSAKYNLRVESKLVLGVLIAYLVDTFFIWMREYYGKRNVAQNTLTDERFLI